MKAALLLSTVLVYLSVSCTTTTVKNGDKVIEMRNFASHTRAKSIAVGDEKNGIRISGWNDNATIIPAALVKEGSKAFRNYMLLKGFEFAAGKYYDNKGAELDSATTLDLERLRNAKSAQDQAHALDILKATPEETATLIPST